jgi:hypothetical protein
MAIGWDKKDFVFCPRQVNWVLALFKSLLSEVLKENHTSLVATWDRSIQARFIWGQVKWLPLAIWFGVILKWF